MTNEGPDRPATFENILLELDRARLALGADPTAPDSPATDECSGTSANASQPPREPPTPRRTSHPSRRLVPRAAGLSLGIAGLYFNG